MGLRINNNVEAFNAHRTLSANSSKLSKSMARLSSGFRINSAADDAAGLALSERMRGQISGLGVAQRNVQDGISFAQTAEGSLQEISSILQRARDLAVQYNNGTGGAAGNAAITAEVTQLSAEVSRIIASAQFNGVTFLQGGAAMTLQVGANGAEQLGVAMVTAETSIGTALSGFATGTANITLLDTAIQNIAAARGQFGAIQNRLEYTNDALGIYQENLMAAESRIRDVDMAEEMTNMTRLQILQESGMAMLAQANQQGSSVLSLLRG
jgi:flagellin